MDAELNLLVVEDDEVDRLAVHRALRQAGLRAQIKVVEREEEAIAALATGTFDCALLDYQLGQGDGLAVLRAVREQGIRTPIIMLTGQGDESIAVELMKAGAADYLPKGKLSPERLQQSLRYALRLNEAEREAERATEALRLLAETSALLETPLEYEVTLASVAQLAVPHFADYCLILVQEKDGVYHRLLSHHPDPTLDTLLQEFVTTYPFNPTAPVGTARVVRTREPELHTEVGEAIYRAVALDEHHLELMRRVGANSFISVPLFARGQFLGALTFCRMVGRSPYDEHDLTLAKELGHRAAMAVDNARLYREAQEAIRTRDAFISIAAHELKTPLTSLYGYSMLLRRRGEREGWVNERDRKAIDTIVEQARRLNKMIESLLDFSRLEAGQLSIERAPVDVVALVKGVVAEVRPTLHQHTLDLHMDCPAPLLIHGDALRLEQVFHNLIQNAVKYSPGGGLVVVRLAREEGFARVEVTDQGIGIAPDAMTMLFTRFYRATAPEVQQVSGLGVGLFVVSEIVALHEGRVQVSSRLGEGSTFSVLLPLTQDQSLENSDQLASHC